MNEKISNVVWTKQARIALNDILDYRYQNAKSARRILRKDIINASRDIVFAKQFQKDDIYPKYRRIIVRDYKLLYREQNSIVFIMNVVCTKTI